MNDEAGMGLAYLIDTLKAALREPPINAEVTAMIDQARGGD
jgi:hypothetical protein